MMLFRKKIENEFQHVGAIKRFNTEKGRCKLKNPWCVWSISKIVERNIINSNSSDKTNIHTHSLALNITTNWLYLRKRQIAEIFYIKINQPFSWWGARDVISFYSFILVNLKISLTYRHSNEQRTTRTNGPPLLLYNSKIQFKNVKPK